jgi:site-specific DNA-methyltransferase (adenine-specific)
MSRLKGSFDAIIADPPYGTTACSWDEVIPFDPLWENYKRLIKGNGAVVLFGRQPFTSKLVMSNLEWFKYEWIWRKTKPQGFMLAKLKPMRIHENILVFSQGKTNNDPQQRIDNMFYSPQGLVKYNKIVNGIKEKSGQGHYRKSQKRNLLQEFTNYPVSILEISSECNPIHPTQKPLALLAYLVRTYTNPSEIILDNTMGSGTTLLAAQNEGRQAIGIDISEEYCKIAVERLRQPSFFSISNHPAEKKPEQLGIGI